MDRLFISYISIALFIYVAPVFSFEKIQCQVPNIYLNDDMSFIFNGFIKIQFNRENFKIFKYENSNSNEVNILIKLATITFTGLLANQSDVNSTAPIKHDFLSKVVGSSLLKKVHRNYILTMCQLFVERNNNNREEKFILSQNQIYSMAAKCLNVELSEKINYVTPEDFAKLTDVYNFGPLSTDPNEEKVHLIINQAGVETRKKLISMQGALNAIIDIGLFELKNSLIKTNMSIIEIPVLNNYDDTNSSYKYDFKDGYFKDASTLERSSDVLIEQTGKTLSVSSGLSLKTAEIHFNYYLLKWGILSTSGSMTAKVKTVDADAKLLLDYTKEKCETNLEYFKFKSFKDFEFDFKRSKMSYIQWAIKFVANFFEKYISELAENALKELIIEKFNEFDCEVYRPAFD